MSFKTKAAIMGTAIKNSAKAILRGEFLMRLNADKYFAHILYCFALIIVAIWISLRIDITMNTVENNTKTITEQEEEIAVKTYKAASLERRSGIETRLGALGSDVHEPQKPATILPPTR